MDYLLSSAQKYNFKFQRILFFQNSTIHFISLGNTFSKSHNGSVWDYPLSLSREENTFSISLTYWKGENEVKDTSRVFTCLSTEQDSSIGDLVTHSLSQWLSDNFRLYDYNDYNDYNNYNDYRDRDRDRDIESDFVNKWQLTITDKLRNLNHDI